MPGRGLTRFVVLVITLFLGILILARFSSTIPAEWKPSLPTSSDVIHVIKPESAAYPKDDLAKDTGIARPIVPTTEEDSHSTPGEKSPEKEDDIAQAPTTPITEHASADVDNHLPDHYIYNNVDQVHRKVQSVSTADQKYFAIDFVSAEGYNPNIIPHPALSKTYIIVAQELEHSVNQSVWFDELVCNARFTNGALKCINPPKILPIGVTSGDKCVDELAFFGYNVGPHDARVFYGPQRPYALFGSNSQFTCFGQFVQDFRVLMDWGFEWDVPKQFKTAIEVQRPDKYGRIEKNFFLFWDANGQIYAHLDIAPARVFAKLNDDGSVGKDLGPSTGDEKCLAKFMPAVAETLESIHQATNSLSITLCNRADSSCIIDDSNTFVFTIFHHKSYYAFHSNYEPYVMLFQRSAPFSTHAIGQKPIWVNGRGLPGEGKRPAWVPDPKQWRQTEMFYITSMSWATAGQKYHGYLDDTLFLAFGIEDSKNGGIDIVAGDLFKDLGYCKDA